MKNSIVIPLGRGSRNNDLELRYCLRSVEKYLTGYGDVFIVGEKPDWLRNVIHIPCPDFGDKTYDKERNIFGKIMAACADDRVSDSFLFMNDDHYLLQEYAAREFPYYYDGRLRDKLTISDYKHTVSNTAAIVSPNVLYADIHCPIIYEKAKFATIGRYNWAVKFGYCIKTLYCYEHVLCSHLRPAVDLKIEEGPYSLTSRPWFSIGDKAFNGDIKRVLQELYPLKSRYE